MSPMSNFFNSKPDPNCRYCKTTPGRVIKPHPGGGTAYTRCVCTDIKPSKRTADPK